MTPYLDFYNLMAYDYSGSWSTIAGHQANLNHSNSNATSTPFYTVAALDYYINKGGVPSSKMVLGMPLYGHTFANTDGPGTRFQGKSDGDSMESGILAYKALPQAGGQEFMESITQGGCGASWSYDPANRMMVSYDTVPMVEEKAKFVKDWDLGGGMWWEVSGDRGGVTASKSDGSLIGTFVDGVSGPTDKGLEQAMNALEFPESQYDNLRAKFPGE